MSKDHPLSFGFMIRIKHGLGFFCFVALLFLSLSPSASAQDAIRQRTFAVLEFDGVGVPDQTMQDVSERFANEYANFKKGEFILLNREQMRQNLQEQNIRVFGCSSFKCGVEAGNALGVDLVFDCCRNSVHRTFISAAYDFPFRSLCIRHCPVSSYCDV